MNPVYERSDNKSPLWSHPDEVTPSLSPVLDLTLLLADLNDKDSRVQLEDLCKKLEAAGDNVSETQKKIICFIKRALPPKHIKFNTLNHKG